MGLGATLGVMALGGLVNGVARISQRIYNHPVNQARRLGAAGWSPNALRLGIDTGNINQQFRFDPIDLSTVTRNLADADLKGAQTTQAKTLNQLYGLEYDVQSGFNTTTPAAKKFLAQIGDIEASAGLKKAQQGLAKATTVKTFAETATEKFRQDALEASTALQRAELPLVQLKAEEIQGKIENLQQDIQNKREEIKRSVEERGLIDWKKGEIDAHINRMADMTSNERWKLANDTKELAKKLEKYGVEIADISAKDKATKELIKKMEADGEFQWYDRATLFIIETFKNLSPAVGGASILKK